MQYVCTEPLRYDATAVNRDIENFKAALAGLSPGLQAGGSPITEGFMPVAAPASIEVGRRNEYARYLYPSARK